MRWRFAAPWKSLFSLFLSPAQDALVALLREYGADMQAEMVLRGDLTELDLGGFRIRDDGAEIVADFLKDNETVRYVWLYSCTIGPSGAKSIAEALRSNETVELLDLESNPFGDEGAETLIEALNFNVWMEWLNVFDESITPKLLVTIKYLTETRNRILIPAAVRRASLFLIAARRNITNAGNLAIFPKEIVRMIAMELYATRKEPIWLNTTLTESERTGKSGD